MHTDSIYSTTTPPHAPQLSHASFTATLSESRLGLRSRKTMLAISHVIEDQAALCPGTTLIAAFQRFSFIMPQLPRYRRIAPQLAQIYLIGVPDVALPELPNTTLVPIEPAWPLMHEWVVLASGPSCCAGLLARDHETLQPGTRSYTFNGMLASQPMIVDAAVGALFNALHQSYTPPERNNQEVIQFTKRVQQTLHERL